MTSETRGRLATLCHGIAESPLFQRSVIGLILFAGILMGVETNEALVTAHKALFHTLDTAIQALFVLEIAIRLTAHAPHWWRFFRDGWNNFDFIVVALSLLPAVGPLATVARMARLLRVVRLLSVVPELRLIINTMMKSLTSLIYIVLLLCMILYIYGVAGYHLFHRYDTENWGSLARSVMTLFEILTLDGWVAVHDRVKDDVPFSWVFFSSFIVLAVFMVVNLFIAVVISNLEKVQLVDEARGRRIESTEAELLKRVEEMQSQLVRFERLLRDRAQKGG
jgi:voltage-gated sodium channel